MPFVGPTLIGVTNTCQPDGGKIAGKATTYASSTVGGVNFLRVDITDPQGNAPLDAAGNPIYGVSGISPLNFEFTGLPDGDYTVTASDDSVEPPAIDQYNVSCQVTPPSGPGNGCDLVITAATTTDNTVAGPTPSTANGSITITATTSSPPLVYSFDGGYYSIQQGASGQPHAVTPFGLTGGSAGYEAGTYRVYVKDAAGCVTNTTVTIADNIPCNVSAQVVIDEDAAFIRNLGTNVLEYDWTGAGVYSDLRFVGGLTPGQYTVHARDKANPTCTADFVFIVKPYPRQRKCCFYVLVIGGQWFPIGEPIGLDEQELVIKRDAKVHGVSFEYSDRALGFDCEAGRDLIQAQRDALGDDAEIGFVEIQRADDGQSLAVVYSGRLNLYDYSDQDGILNCNVEQSNTASLLAARIKTATDLFGTKTLDGATLPDVNRRRAIATKLHSKAIVKVGHYAADGSYADSGPRTDTNGEREPFIVLGFNSPIVENLETFYQQTSGFSFIQERYEFHKATEAGPVTFEFNVNAQATISLTRGRFREVFCELFFQKNNDPAERLVYIHADGLGLGYPVFDSNNYGNGYRASGTRQLTLAVGDKLYLYGKLFVEDYKSNSEFVFGLLLDKSSFVKVTAETLGPESTAYMFPIYEALDRSLEISLGQPGLLRSDFYGRTDSNPRTYPANGFGSKFVLGSGFMIRGIAQKPFAPSFQDILDGLVPIHNIGLAVQPDPVNAQDVVRVEGAESFYENVLALRLDSCEKFARKSDPTRQPNLVVVGYEKWQPEGRVENALDEPNSIKQFATPTRLNPVQYTQKSKFIAGAYLLESERRLGTSDTDGPNDNDTFIVAVHADEYQKNVIGWSFYGVSESITVPYTPGDPILAGGDKIIVASGPNAGVYTIQLIQPDNSGTFGPPALAFIVLEPLPDPNAPFGVLVSLGSSYKAERDEAFASVQNLYSPSTAYNLRITPARNLRRHGLFLNAGTYYKQPAELYRNTYGEGNLRLETRLIGETLAVGESADVSRANLAPLASTPLIPETLSFNAYLDRAGFNALRAKRHGFIAVFDGEQWFTGFILSVKWKRRKNKGTFQLIRRAGDFDPTATARLLEFDENEFGEPEFN